MFCPRFSAHVCFGIQGIIKSILAETQRLADVARFIEICLFDTLVGNNDRHGRNLGIIETASVKKLAPMYDNPSCLGIEEEFFLLSDVNPSGSIWTQATKEPKAKDYIIELRRLGYEKIVSQFSSKIISRSENIIRAIINTEISEIRKNALIKLIKKRIGDFENAK